MASKSGRRQHASYYTHTRYSMASASTSGGGSRHSCGAKSTRSRIPPGVRPWLSKRLEELWGIDGQVYSHYILSVLLDGVDNEFLIETSSSDPHQGKRPDATSRASKRNRSKPKNLRSAAGSNKNQHPGGLLDSSMDSDDTATSDDSSWGVDENENGGKCGIGKSFEKRKMAVVTYLNRHAYEDNEVNSLVEELIERLGCGPPKRQEQVKAEQHRKRNANSNKSSKVEHAEQKRFFGPPIAVNRCASLNDCAQLKHEEKGRQAGWVAFKMGRNRIKKSGETGNKRDSRDQVRKSRGRIASLDECQSVFLPKLILKGERTRSSIGPKSADSVKKEAGMFCQGPRESSRKRFSSEDSSSCDVHSENQEANFGLPLNHGMRNASSFLIDFSSDCEDGDEFFDFSISFLDSYDDLDETYNEAFPSLIETHTGQHFFALTTCQNAVNIGTSDRAESSKEKGTFEVTVGASRVSLPPNPVSKGQPVWSSKVKAPIGRPMNRKYADAEISNSIIEGANVLLTIDEVVKRSQLSESENGNDTRTESTGCPYNSYHSLLADRELDSILNMIGLTPEKMPGMRDNAGRCTENQFNFDVSESLRTFSKCTKDLFQSKNPEVSDENESECDLKKGLLSPELSKIWDRDEAERKNIAEGLEASSSLNSLTESDDQLLQSRKMSSGTINPDPVWMPTEADLGTSLNSATRDPRATQNSLLANVEISVTVPTHEACFDLLAGFPGILLSPGIDDESSAVTSQDGEKCECKNKISSSFCNCSDPDVKFPDVYFSTYNPQLFDLLDLYMLGENIGFTTNGSTDLFTLGNFYRKRDIYFDDYFAESIPSAVEQRPMSGSDSSLPPLLTEHFLMEIMKFNEQCSPSTPVGSEFDTGSLFDDRSSEVTTLQQRANSLIMRHQRMYQQTATGPDTVDAAMQTDAEQNDEEHRISPQVVTEDEPSLNDELVEPIDPVSENGLVEIGTQLFASLIEQEEEVSAVNAPKAEDSSAAFQFEPKLTPWSVASSSFVTESQDALTAATTTTASTVSDVTTANAIQESSSKEFETFKCPAGCDPNAEPSGHSHVQGEDLLISPKTHFRPISVQSVEEDDDLNEVVYDEQLTIEQTLDGFAPQGSNFLEINSEIKDSRLFTSWCKGIAQPTTEAPRHPEIQEEKPDQTNPNGRNSEALRSIWERSIIAEDETTKEQSKELVVNQNGEVVPSLWCPNVDKNASTSNWVSSSTNHFESKSASLTTEFEPGNIPQLQETVDVTNPYLGLSLNNPAFDIDPVEELEFVFDHEMNKQNTAFSAMLNQQTPVYPAEFPVGFIPMETLSDVDCKCVADLPGELGIDPNCQLHGAGAAIYITTGDNHSLSSGGDWSIGSSSSFRALPATTAFNPNLIVGYQGTFGSFGGGNSVGGGGGKQKKSQQKGANVTAANILQLNQSIVSQRQKKRSRSSKSEKDTKSASKPCSYFLEGGCHRSDCKFSHDLANIPCRFFAEGGCFKSIFCPFKHAIPTEVVGSQIEMSNGDSKTSTESSEDLQVGGDKSCGSSESISAEMSSAKETSETDYCWQPIAIGDAAAPGVKWPEMPLVAETAAKPKSSKRRRCKTRSKKNPPNLKDNMEFPILPNDVVETKDDEIEDAAAHLRLSSIYPSEGFVNFNDVAVM